MEDCNAAILMNPNFARTYKRLFKAHVALGNISEAKEALHKAVSLEQNDPSNKKDTELMETVEHQSQMIEKFGGGDIGMSEDQDFEKAANYCTSILQNCPSSIKFAGLKVKYLLLSNKLSEANEYSQELMRVSFMSKSVDVQVWRGRVLIYNGQEAKGKEFLMDALRNDPENREARLAVRAIKSSASIKIDAGNLFKENKLAEAIAKFDEALALDPLNLTYNATILLNKAIALVKQKKNDDALKALN